MRIDKNFRHGRGQISLLSHAQRYEDGAPKMLTLYTHCFYMKLDGHVRFAKEKEAIESDSLSSAPNRLSNLQRQSRQQRNLQRDFARHAKNSLLGKAQPVMHSCFLGLLMLSLLFLTSVLPGCFSQMPTPAWCHLRRPCMIGFPCNVSRILLHWRYLVTNT